MRRSMGRRGNNHSGGGGNGPLITEHLQDIDMELELLKRKREMIEQQQQLLVMEQQFKTSRHSLDQMRYDEPGSNRDYTHMYGSGPKHGNQFGRKRQAENQWQYDSGPKRAPPKKKSQFNQNGSGNFRIPKSGGGKPAPLMDIKVKPSIGQRISNQKGPQKAPKKDFAPSKVAKPKAPPAPNKLASLPVAERKNLVAAAKGSSSDRDMSRMLMPYRVPSQQVTGRLELALGAIMKNIKEYIETNKPEQANMLRTHQLQRVMKQAVRERIRTVMLGKVVGSLVEILAIYREEFPEETDADVVNIAIEAGGVSAPVEKPQPKFIESADPSDFFKNNMIKLVETRLTEMFTKLEDIYSSKVPTTEDTAEEATENAPENATENVTEEVTEKATEEATEKATEEATEKATEEATEKATEEATEKATVEATEKATEEATEKATEEAPEKATEQLVDLQKPSEPKEDQNEYKEFLNTTIKVFEVKRILPRLIKKYIPYVIKLLNVDAMYQNTQAAITMKTNEKAARKASIKKPDESQDDDKTTVTELRAEGRYNLPYYVKIMGRPNLPKKKAMQTFLNQFNPKSIKKHRAIHNLLFVGFTEKEDFDVMVAADGTVIGKSTLSIRICNKTGPKEENDESNNVNQESTKQEPQNDGEIVGADLDGQITDLLSAIRKSEEEEDTAQKENVDQTENKDGEENVIEQAEGNNDVMDEGVGDGNNDEEMNENAGNEEENENAATDEVETQANECEAQDTEAANEFNTEVPNGTEKSETIDISDDSKDGNTQEGDIEMGDKTSETSEPTKTGAAGATGRSTPSRMSTRLANVTPSTIRTRRASRLAPQN